MTEPSASPTSVTTGEISEVTDRPQSSRSQGGTLRVVGLEEHLVFPDVIDARGSYPPPSAIWRFDPRQSATPRAVCSIWAMNGSPPWRRPVSTRRC